jgi:hypothetical protein
VSNSHLAPLPTVDELPQQVAEREEVEREEAKHKARMTPTVNMLPVTDKLAASKRQHAARGRVDDEYEKKRLEVQKASELKQERLERHRTEKALKRRAHGQREVASIMNHGWATLLFAIAALKTMKEIALFNKMTTKELADMVKKSNPKSWGKQSDTSFLFSRGMEIVRIETDPDLQKKLPYIQAMFSGRLNILRRRKSAVVVYKALEAWSQAGRVIKALRTYHFQMRRIQSFCRSSRVRLRERMMETCFRWHEMETDIARDLVRARRSSVPQRQDSTRASMSPAKRKQSMFQAKKSVISVGLTEKDLIKLNLTPEDVQVNFLAHELRIMRFKWLTKAMSFRTRLDHYYEEVVGWREHKAACEAVGKEWNTFKYPPPELPPCPVASPTDEELLEMIHRCRKDPEDLTPIPVSRHTNAAKADVDNEADRDPFHVEEKVRPGKSLLSARDYLPRVPPEDEFD